MHGQVAQILLICLFSLLYVQQHSGLQTSVGILFAHIFVYIVRDSFDMASHPLG